MLGPLGMHVRHNVVAYLALFVALGGTSYAAIKLPANSVGTKQIQKRAVTPAKLAQSTIARFKGQKGDVGAQGIQGLQGPQGLPGLPGAKGDAGPQGPTGARGPTGTQGPTGARGPTGPEGQTGLQGPTGAQGVPGTARAYGRVNGTSVTRSKGVVSVSNPAAGVHCIVLDPSIDISKTGVSATPDIVGGATTSRGFDISIAFWRSDAADCPAGSVEVQTGRHSSVDGGAAGNYYENRPFFFIVP